MRTTALALLMMGAVLGAVSPAQAAPPEATISNFSFSPDPVAIPLGSTLKWTNADGVTHTVTADDGSFSSGNLAKDATFTHTFNRAGPVAYHCAIHSSMHGTVQVEGATTTTASPTTTTTAAQPSTTSTTQAPTSMTTAAAPVATTAPAPRPTAPKPAVSSTTRGTAAPAAAAPTTTTAVAPTTTAPPTTAAPPASAPADAPPSTTLPTQVALDSPSGRSGGGGAGARALAAGIAAVVLLGGAGWALRRRFSAG